MENEIWKEVEGIEDYFISNKGRVKSLKKNNCRILKPKIDKDGYYEYCLLGKNNKRIYKRGHRLVAEAFIPNHENLPLVNHKNLIKNDNNVNNLEWCNNFYNTVHSYKNTLNKKSFSHLTEEDFNKAIELYKNGYYYSDLNKYFDLEIAEDLWTDIFSGRRFSNITKIYKDIRDGRNKSYTKTDDTIINILNNYFLSKKSQSTICKELNLNPSYVSRIVNRKKRIELYDKFMEENNIDAT